MLKKSSKAIGSHMRRLSTGGGFMRKSTSAGPRGFEEDAKKLAAYHQLLAKTSKSLEKYATKLLDDHTDTAQTIGTLSSALLPEKVCDMLVRVAGLHTTLKSSSSNLHAVALEQTVQHLQRLKTEELARVEKTMERLHRAVAKASHEDAANAKKQSAESREALRQAEAERDELRAQLTRELEQLYPSLEAQIADALRGYLDAFERHAQTLLASSGAAAGGAAQGSRSGIFGEPLAADSQGLVFALAACSHLESRALKDRTLFRADNAPELATEALREQLVGGSFELDRVHSLAVGVLLIEYVAALPKPLLGSPTDWIEAGSAAPEEQVELFRAQMEALPDVNRQLFSAIVSLCVKVNKVHVRGGMGASRLGVEWAKAMQAAPADEPALGAALAALVLRGEEVLGEKKAPRKTEAAVLPSPRKKPLASPRTPAPRAPSPRPASPRRFKGKGKGKGNGRGKGRGGKLAKRKFKVKGKKLAKSPRRASPRRAPPPAGASAAVAIPKVRIKETQGDSYDSLDGDSDEEEYEYVTDSEEGDEEEEEGPPARLMTSQADIDDAQTLGVLGMMLSPEKRI